MRGGGGVHTPMHTTDIVKKVLTSILHLLPFTRTKSYFNKELLEVRCINFSHYDNDRSETVLSKQQRHKNDINEIILVCLHC